MKNYESTIGADEEIDHDRLKDLVYNSLSAEFASVRDGKPAVYPVVPYYDHEQEIIAVTSPPAYAGKIENVRHNSRVALLLHDDGGEYLVIGDGQIRDIDLDASAEKNLIRNEPETPKRGAVEEGVKFYESRLGQLLFGWYALRLVVDITPRSMVRLGDRTSIAESSNWEAADMDADEANTYERTVLSIVGEDGYPLIEPFTSLTIDGDGATLDSELTASVDDEQFACLLLHFQSENGNRNGQRVIRGRILHRDGSSIFVPGSSYAFKLDGVLDFFRFMLDGRRRTKAYFRKNPR
ncbi:pyridoxamine 5'-phosphate oxidase family protein [Halobacteria archaeon AArc-curdl1]|uniref:Pyridoxamine 5'-phosphate oxidase family protein n=1 Tax=Natronosalvus hydrolyticus TaxID=2979988 RepID=A0AAP3E5A1_9EURY|nr:pyridoxamine 5'-phosphate oxidase family protein [Halobacteria archaeon AArc-curdl1]